LGTLVLTIVNILGDFLNVFVLHWGMFGMALMTSISYYSDLAVIMHHYLSERYSLKILGHGIDFSSIPDIVKAGLTTAFQRAANVVKLAGINRLLFFMASASAVASFTVGKAGSNLYFPIAISVGMTTLMVGSAFVSEEDKSSLLIILRTMFMYCYGPILIITIVILILAKPLTALFLAESEPSFRDAYMVNLCMIASLPFHAINNGMINYLQSIGKVRSSMIFTVMENGAFPIACACGLGFIFGVKGVWISLFVTEIIMFLVIIGYDAFCEKKVPRTVEDFLMIGKEFGVAAEDEFRSTLTDQEGVIACSEEIRQFCISRNLPKRTAMLMALCVEEMCGNIIKHGFKPGKKNTIDIRLFCKEGKITLRVRDNCKPFDPKKQYEIYKQEGDVSNYGIRMIAQMTSDMRYVNLMRMNVLYMETCI
jgi:anti-sigma regulatory factor (Ser/Thr protein kinase)